MEEQDRKINEFCSITGVQIQNAGLYLEAAEWNVELALLNFYDLVNAETKNTQAVDNMDVDEQNEAKEVVVDVGETTTVTPNNTPSMTSLDETEFRIGHSEIGTLSSLRQDSNSLNNSDSLQAFFAGGSVYSGQQIIGPNNRNGKTLMELLRTTKKNVIFKTRKEAVAPASPSLSYGSSSAFQGPGHRLGHPSENLDDVNSTTMPQSAILTQSSPSSSFDETISDYSNIQSLVDVILRIYGDGFTVNDGPLRNLDNPRDREFVQMIMQGLIPPEIAPRNDAQGIRLKVEDHSFQEYSVRKSKKASAVPFSGQGNVLGSTSSKQNDDDDDEQHQQTKQGEQGSLTEYRQATNEQPSPILIDENSPVTTVQVRLSDGRTFRVTLNHHHTIGDLRSYITTLGPQYTNGNFRLVTSFPSQELDDTTATVEQAGILNSSILLRVK